MSVENNDTNNNLNLLEYVKDCRSTGLYQYDNFFCMNFQPERLVFFLYNQ